MLAYLVRRLLRIIPTLFGILLIVFLMIRLVPGDPARIMAGEQATAEDVENLRRQLGLDKPIHTQFLIYLASLLQGDLGISLRTRQPVMSEILTRFPATLELSVAGMFVSILIGVPAGVISAVRRYSISDNIAMLIALFGLCTPAFWLGLMLILLFSVTLGWLPAAERGGIEHLILPAITVGMVSTAIITRQTRSSMLEVITQDYITTARAKGNPEKVVILKHALKNALIPVVTIAGLQFGTLLGGAILTETVFAWPGIGRLLVDSIFARDYPVVQGVVLFFSLSFVLVNLFVDILYAYLDPRIVYD